MRGYHGARVQGIARRAGCNVALLYRHWASKKALYLDVLGSVWSGSNTAVSKLLEKDAGASGVVSAYLDALLADPEGAQILVREYLDGAPHIQKLAEDEPALLEPLRRATESFASGDWRRHAAELVLLGLFRGGAPTHTDSTLTDSG